MSWSAQQYLKYESERRRPVRDLVAAIPRQDAATCVDLGCGPGTSTELLAARFPDATILAVDGSSDMLAQARKRMPAIRFEMARIESWDTPGSVDVIFSNAVLQWLPEHEKLFPRLIQKLNPGGVLAIQMPVIGSLPAHEVMGALAAEAQWAERLKRVERPAIHHPGWYYELLAPLCSSVDLWLTTYYHPLPDGMNDVVEWFRGSSLRHYLDRLNSSEQELFINRFQNRLSAVYPALPDGTVLLPFPRQFVVAVR